MFMLEKLTDGGGGQGRVVERIRLDQTYRLCLPRLTGLTTLPPKLRPPLR